MQSISEIRKEYTQAELDISHVMKNPVEQFQQWFHEALEAKVIEPNAMTLSTVKDNNQPSARIVLLKGVEEGQFIFFTNYQSDKGIELEKNPSCSLTFFWAELERQVRIEGIARRISPEKSDLYFKSRPRGSQIGAWSSPQSAVISDRNILHERVKLMEMKFEGQEILPKPQQWGGYAVEPFLIEFWQGRPSRLHDRIEFIKDDSQWKVHRLAP
jgi:pyridoxamine 5'-phosphate oxidase